LQRRVIGEVAQPHARTEIDGPPTQPFKPRVRPRRLAAMGKSNGRASNHQAAASAAAPPAGNPGMVADRETDAQIAAWKAAHIAKSKAEQVLELARGVVKAAFDRHAVRFIASSSGTVALQPRAGATKVDWESLARALVPAARLERELPKFTTTGSATNVLAAPREWGVEAGR
jgi:hypothetical protein